MKRITDAQVAKALGWRKVHAKRQWGGKPCKVWERGDIEVPKLPAFTTSLDAIVAEIEARGLHWTKTAQGRMTIWPANGWHEGEGKTDALAICAALLAYLKEKP